MMDIKEIDGQQAHDIINSSDIEGQYEPRGLFICKECNVYVGIDNSDGCCWTEDFKSKGKCRRWLLDE